ncbi:MAG: hypothetical protein ACD_20C00169G0008 [uncultured bacterium]|nr:MAG: hypothetical protein ACD_20C00169G0008 [uncultured bacterium]HBH18846.1 hypothetical protein [Cyanobacteria bacterium UBA9579]
MKIYNYHPITREFISESTADESPLEKGVYLIPGNATKIAPPQAGENEIACFENGSWLIKTDFRGKIYYKKDTLEEIGISEIGMIPDKTMTDIKPGDYDSWDSALNAFVLDREKKLNKVVRPQRDRLIAEAEKLVNLHRNQKELLNLGSGKINSAKMKISDLKYKEILEYMQDLRDFPEICNAENPVFPEKPF